MRRWILTTLVALAGCNALYYVGTEEPTDGGPSDAGLDGGPDGGAPQDAGLDGGLDGGKQNDGGSQEQDDGGERDDDGGE